VLQRAAAMVLEAVYEQDFHDCSYGFRPKRSAHQAVEALRNTLMEMRGGWVLEIDVRKFFDTVDHGCMREILRRRVLDGVLLRLIDKWLNAGVLEDGGVSYPGEGTPQGGVISPLLANIYLHHVLDEWFQSEVKPRLQSVAHLFRYADDAVMVFASERDARRVMSVLPKRFDKYGLHLHPDKTRLLAFGRPPRRKRGEDGRDDGPRKGPGTFDMLGFTFYWGLSVKGNWVVKQRTAKDRLRRALHRVASWCREHLHDPVRTQWQMLCAKLRGHDAYYGISGNKRSLVAFHLGVVKAWKQWLDRRSSHARMSWNKMTRLLERYPLPAPRIMHSYLSRAANPVLCGAGCVNCARPDLWEPGEG